MDLKHLAISRITEPNDPERILLDPQAIEDLAQSLDTVGLIHPIHVRRNPDGAFEIISGHRRYCAARALGWDTIPAFVSEADDGRARACAIAENLFRADLTPIEEALTVGKLLHHYGQEITTAASAIGRTEAWVQSRLDMLAWPTSIMEAVHERQLTIGSAHELARIEHPEDQERLLRWAIAANAPVNVVRAWRNQVERDRSEGLEPRLPSTAPEDPAAPVAVILPCAVCGDGQPHTQLVPIRLCRTCASAL